MKRWTEDMSEEDMAFVKRFVLASGSLKAMAAAYGVSYPTVRLRLDRLIQKIEVRDDARVETEFERVLRIQFADGRIDAATFKTLLRAHLEEVQDRHEG